MKTGGAEGFDSGVGSGQRERAFRVLNHRGGGERDAAMAAVVGVILIHLLAIWAMSRTASLIERIEIPEPLMMAVSLELIPDEVDPEEEQYVMANPSIEEAVPDKTNNFSDRNQVAAQEDTVPLSENEDPLIEGDSEDSNRIVQGASPTQTDDVVDPSSLSPGETMLVEQQPAPKSRPSVTAPDVIIDERKATDGLMSLEKPQDNPELKAIEDTLDRLNPIEKESPLDGQGSGLTFTPPQQEGSTQREPRPRPKVPVYVPYGPLKKNLTGVVKNNRMAINSRLTEFGVYLDRVLEMIDRRWRQLSYDTRSISLNGNWVTIRFMITREGSVTDLKVIESGVGRWEEIMSVDSIKDPAPYPRWTPEMIAALGTEEEITIKYIY